MGGGGRSSMVLVAVALFTTTCGLGSESQLTEASPDWATEAVDRVDAMEIAYDAADVYSTALFYTAGGTLDLTVWNQGVQVTPDGVVEAHRRMWFQSGNRADVRAEHVFVSLDGAIVWWHAFDPTGSEHWAQTYAFVANRTASRAYLGLERPFASSIPDEESIVALVSDCVAAWSAGDAESLTAVYAADATVTDAVRATTFSGVDEMELADPRPIDVGPWPEVFLYRNGEQVEAVVIVQLGGECPMLEARRWVLVDDVITHETR